MRPPPTTVSRTLYTYINIYIYNCSSLVLRTKFYCRDSDHVIVHLGLNVSSSAHNCGCVVESGNAMAAI